ncbi:MAG: glycosyltransferase [Bacteroidales bacterium]|nr:glycosyltransferase [Bacteroidales bacterium]
MLVSVIIPVYNAAPFIGKCMESVLGQTLESLELICVDDHSSDNSLEVMSGFTDSRLKIIHFPENKGVSAARNAGLDAASGEYVYFLDSDDWLDLDYLEVMCAKAEDSGDDVIVNSNYIEEFPESGKRALSSRFGFVEDEPGYYPMDVIQNRFPPVVWARLFRRRFLVEKDIHFPPPFVRNGTEDIFFTGLASSYHDKALVFRGPYYHYLQRQESLLHQKDLYFHNIVSFKALHDERKTRNLPTEGLRLFYGGTVILDTEEKFDFAKSFFSEIAPEVRRHTPLYAPLDLFLMEAVLSCEDYSVFKARFNPNISISFIRNRMRIKP